ncbi:hypothetical protein L2E82_30718 [Cichorium intybus]|uniref:Uncharacterized protein n=1 Tax=Cichorium intybus TaxID=13427 RepID=A0ACB9D1V5_CICIN|nr:hypothetical protein L2E82_30718 [Cichorium intybus]
MRTSPHVSENDDFPPLFLVLGSLVPYYVHLTGLLGVPEKQPIEQDKLLKDGSDEYLNMEASNFSPVVEINTTSTITL